MMAFVHLLFGAGKHDPSTRNELWRFLIGGDALETGSVCVTYLNRESGTHPTKSHGAKGAESQKTAPSVSVPPPGFGLYGVVPGAQFAEGAFHDDILIGLLFDRAKA